MDSQLETGRLPGRLREQARSHHLDRMQQLETGWLLGRHREQAHSYIWIAYSCKKQVGCQAAFASRLAPTVGLRTSKKKIGRLSGRLREQARSYSWIAYICKKQVGYQAAFASRLAPTEEQSKAMPTTRSSPLNRMSVSSAAAFDLRARRQAEWRD